MKKYIKNISNKEEETSKSFWNTIKPFITNKGIQEMKTQLLRQRKMKKQRLKAYMKKLIKKLMVNKG